MKAFFLSVCIFLCCDSILSQKITGANKYFYEPFDTIRVQGSNFNTSSSSVFIRLGSVSIKPISLTNTEIAFIAPQNIYTGRVIYQDIANKVYIQSYFNVNISTPFKGFSALDKLEYHEEDRIALDTFEYVDQFQHSLFADLDNDGDEDMVSAQQGFSIPIYLNKNGILHHRVTLPNHPGILFALRDFNNDGKIDILTLNLINRNIKFWLNKSNKDTLAFKDSMSRAIDDVAAPINPFDLVDFNGDGRMDINKGIAFWPTDTFIYLNKVDTAGKMFFKRITRGSTIPVLSTMRPVNLDDDGLTDILARSYNGNGDITYLYKNSSRGDTIQFQFADSFINQSPTDNHQMADFNKDNLPDLLLLNTDYNNNYRTKVTLLLNQSHGDTVKFKEIKISPYLAVTYNPVLWDYNYDSVPDLLYSNNDTLFCLTLQIVNDTLKSKRTIIDIKPDRRLDQLADIDQDNKPEIFCKNLYTKEITILKPDASSMELQERIINFTADSVNQVLYDSITLVYHNVKPLQFDTIVTRYGITFFDSRSYSGTLQYPFTIRKDSTIRLYFSYQFKQDILDTIRVNYSKNIFIGIINAKYQVPCAYIRKIDKTAARPGDTIVLHGNYFFRHLNDVSVRINNRRCTVLNSSSDTLLQFIYPAMASPARILITDTSKHYNVYSKELIYPTFRSDTGVLFNQYTYDPGAAGAYRDYTPPSIAWYQNSLELPAGLNTGQLIESDDCIDNANIPNRMLVGRVYMQPYIYPSEFKKCQFKTPKYDVYTFLSAASSFSDGYFRMADYNTDGKLDYLNLADSNSVYFCNKITDSSVEYSSKTKISMKPNPAGVSQFRMATTESLDLDMDGATDYVTFPNTNDDSIYFFRYEVQSNKMLYETFLDIPTQCYFYKMTDLTNDGKADIILIESDPSKRKNYFMLENTSRKGKIQFSSNRILLGDSTNSTNMFFDCADFNSDLKLDLIMNDNSGHYRVYISNTSKPNKFDFLDSFTLKKDRVYRYLDINADGRVELFGNRAYSYEIKNGKFLMNKLDIDSTVDFMKFYVEDVDGDFKPDLVQNGNVWFNTTSFARFGSYRPLDMELNPSQSFVQDSLLIYNTGSRNIHLTSLTINDTNFYVGQKNRQSLAYPVLIKPEESIKIYITFAPRQDHKRSYFPTIQGNFAEDMQPVYKQVWGYVNQPPVITKVLPGILMAGDTAAIIGQHFDCLKSRPVVNFADSRAEVIDYDDTLILVKVPNGCMQGVVTVYDTMADLICFSPRPLHYSFVGNSTPSNPNSFIPTRYTKRNNRYFVFDSDVDGLPDLNYDSGSYPNLQGSYCAINQSSTSAFKFKIKPTDFSTTFLYDQLWKDFNGDGKMDYINYAPSSGVSVNLFLTSNLSYKLYDNYSYMFNGLAITDLNKNGKMELSSGQIVSLMDFLEINRKVAHKETMGDGLCNYYDYFKTTRYTNTTINEGYPIFAYDFDGDGIHEAIYDDTAITVAFNNSTLDSFIFSGKVLLSIAERRGFKVLDLDMDGKLDIATVTQELYSGINRLCIFRNTSTKGSLSFTKYLDTVKASFSNDYFDFQDLNGDTKPDMILHGAGRKDSFLIINNYSSAGSFSFKKYCKIKTRGKIRESKFADMNGDGKVDIVVQTDSGTFIFKNANVSGLLSRTSYTFTQLYGFPLSVYMAIYSTGGDTLIIDKIRIPAGYKLVNLGGLINPLGNQGTLGLKGEVTIPLKIAPRDSFGFYVVLDEYSVPGKYKDTLLFYNNQGSAPYRFIASGEIKSAPLAYNSKTELQFGKKRPGQSGNDSFYVKNIGVDTLKLSSILLRDTVNFKLTFNKQKKYLLVGDSLFFKVKFQSQAKGKYVSDVTINHNDYTGKTVVDIFGECILPTIVSNMTYVFKPQYVFVPNPDTVYLINTGTDSLLVTDLKISATSQYSFTSNKQANDLVFPGDTIKLMATFTPNVLGFSSAQISITHNAPNKTTTVQLIGSGISAIMTPNTRFVDFGKLKCGVTYSSSQSYSNTNDPKLKIHALANSSGAFNSSICTGTPDSLSIGKTGNICLTIRNDAPQIINDTLSIGSNSIDTLVHWYLKAQFIKPHPIMQPGKTSYTANVFQTDQAKLILTNIGDDTLVNITHKLNGNAAFRIIDSVGFRGKLLPMKSQGFIVEFNPADTGIFNDIVSFKFGNDTSTLTIGITGIGLRAIPLLQARDTVISKYQKSARINIPVYNKGNRSLTIDSLTHSNPAFAISSAPVSINGKDSFDIEVVFTPNVYQKWYHDTIKLYSRSDTIQYTNTTIISGKCLYPFAQLSKTGTIKFPDTKVYTTSYDSVVITNSGDDTLNLSITSLKDFSQPDGIGTFELLPSQSLKHRILFSPILQKQYTDSFEIDDNSPVAITRFMVSGLGIFNRDHYKLSVSSSRIDFGTVNTGLTKRDSIKLSNEGIDTLNIHFSAIDLPFENSIPVIKLAPSGYKYLPVSFSPTNKGQFTDTIIIFNEFQDSITTVSLSGNGHNTSITQLSASDGIVLYPNPVDDILEITANNNNGQSLHAKICDLAGRDIDVPSKYSGNVLQLYTRNLANGVYIVYLEMNGLMYQTKVIVAH